MKHIKFNRAALSQARQRNLSTLLQQQSIAMPSPATLAAELRGEIPASDCLDALAYSLATTAHLKKISNEDLQKDQSYKEKKDE